MAEITGKTLTDNDFFTGLSNLALILKLFATNTSSIPRSYVDSFTTDVLANGDTKLFVFSDLPNVTDYSQTSSLLTVTKVATNEEVITVQNKKQIKSSYNEHILTMAFTSDSGMNEFVGYLLGQMESSKDKWLYEGTNNQLFGKSLAGKQLIEIPWIETSSMTSPTEINSAELLNNKRMVTAMQNVVNNLSIFTSNYNAMHYTQALNIGDMKLVITDPYHNEAVVNLYASLLKSSEITKSFAQPEKYVIPTDAKPSGQENVIGWLMHKTYYQIFYKFIFMGKFFDVSNLMINNFLTFWYADGFLDNLPCVKFVKKTVTV